MNKFFIFIKNKKITRRIFVKNLIYEENWVMDIQANLNYKENWVTNAEANWFYKENWVTNTETNLFYKETSRVYLHRLNQLQNNSRKYEPVKIYKIYQCGRVFRAADTELLLHIAHLILAPGSIPWHVFDHTVLTEI